MNYTHHLLPVLVDAGRLQKIFCENVMEGLEDPDLPPAQGSAGKIDCDKQSILEQAANRVCGAACPDKAKDGFYRGFAIQRDRHATP